MITEQDLADVSEYVGDKVGRDDLGPLEFITYILENVSDFEDLSVLVRPGASAKRRRRKAADLDRIVRSVHDTFTEQEIDNKFTEVRGGG